MSGQPNEENGNNAEENQVSNTSSSCLMSNVDISSSDNLNLAPIFLTASFVLYAETQPYLVSNNGNLWPHQSCLDTHQSLKINTF